MSTKVIARTSAKSGLTLVEAAIAVMILCIATVGASMLVVQSTKVADQARDHYIAVNLARNRIERAKSMSYSNLTSMNETGTVVNVDGDTADPIDSGNFMRSTAVSVGGTTNLTQMVVTVAIRNRVTLGFSTNEVETMTCEFTQY